jgi:hypothetical protein
MPQQIYPGQSKFHSQDEEAKLTKRRADARLRMAKWRQSQSSNQATTMQANKRDANRIKVTKWRQMQSTKQDATIHIQQNQSNNRVAIWRAKQRQEQKNADQASEQLMSVVAMERYGI